MAVHLTYWTIGLALTLYLITLLCRLKGRSHIVRTSVARMCWTVGYLLFVLHVLFAFGTFHHWSHNDVYAFTARRTAESVGLNWGGGVYVNYLFMAVWGLDVLWWWAAGTARFDRRSRWIEWPLQAFLAFFVFNGAVVFARPMTQALGWLGTALLCLAALSSLIRARRDAAPDCGATRVAK